MAGTGKSTISRTVATSFNEKKILGASFFFKRGGTDRGTALKFFPTIARQLAVRIPELLPQIQRAVQNNPGIATKTMREQFNNLLLQPLRSLKLSDHSSQSVVTIVVDALDECERDDDIRLILQFLPQLQILCSLRVRVFLTSRPELPIRFGFSKIANSDYTDLILHDIPERAIEHDISLFLEQRLSAIRKNRLLPVEWPGDTAIESLVKISVPLFIFAATMCRILDDLQWDPMDSLSEILAYPGQNDGSLFDRTYLPILKRLLNGQSQYREKQRIREFREILSVIVVLESPFSVTTLSRFIDIGQAQIELRLSSLHSVLIVPTDATRPVRLFHLSFNDFLRDPETRDRTPFWVDEKQTHHQLAKRCLQICGTLRKNMCQLNPDTKRTTVDRQAIDRHFPPELQYSCRYWAHHLIQSQNPIAEISSICAFLQDHFLNWMEAMSLLGWASETITIINMVHSLIDEKVNMKLSRLLYDAKRFTRRFLKIVDETPLQVYSSALIFAPKLSLVRTYFEADVQNCVTRLPDVEDCWTAELQTLEGHTDTVWCVKFSQDGRILASSSEDATVMLWDTETGALQHLLEGHSDRVRCVEFSSDDRLLASGSNDDTVRLWDTTAGTLQCIFEGHSNWVRCIFFSPDDGLLVSGSYDHTVKVWDIATKALHYTLEGHSGWIRSISFGARSQFLISSSDDMTIRVWDVLSGALWKVFQGHSAAIWCFDVAHDGQILASGSDDQTIKLWNVSLGTLHGTLYGHSSWIRSVVFSSDSTLLASGSGDSTIKIWDTATRLLKWTLKGHSDSIWTVRFCPNGRLASASEDKTIRLWNSQTGVLEHVFDGHGRPALSLEFSPDGQALASGSYDTTIKIWDTNARQSSNSATAHSGLVLSMALI